MKVLVLLVKKDLLVEFRSKETITLLVALSLLLGVVAAFGINSAFLSPDLVRRMFPAFLWMVFIFTATVSIGRSYDFELEHMGIEGLILSGVSPALIYCSKFLTNFLIVLPGHLFSLCVMAVLFNVNVLPVAGQLVLLSVLVTAAYCALSTVLAAMASTSRLKDMLLPLILLPLLFPVFFGALETTADLLARGAINTGSFWFSLIIALNFLYLVLGAQLYGHVIRE